MTKKILISLSIIGLVAAIVVGGTIAYFSDTETSTGNTFTAGSIDLTVDNTCYYNGMECSGNTWGNTKEPCACTWGLDDLDGHIFFNFADLKPGDWGEDTISLHVTSNDAWSCANITLTENKENGMSEPESKVDTTWGEFGGELAQNLQFIWWADDGDNVLEDDELVVVSDRGPVVGSDPVGGVPLSAIVGNDWTRDLTTADAEFDMFDGPPYQPGSPLTAGTEYYIGKAWCFGDLTINPLTPGSGYSPTNAGNVTCDGTNVTNICQTDMVKGTLEFYVEQYRNNPEFLCPEHLDYPR